MTHFVKFMRSTAVTFARGVSKRGWRQQHENELKLLKSVEGGGKSQQRCLSALVDCYGDDGRKHGTRRGEATMLLAASYAFLGFFEKEDEEKEPALITTIKRSILLIQKKEYKKAEQMLHVALRQAQSLQNQDGITYVYDVMANLAFEVGEYDKAEKLFRSVMQRVISNGTPEDDIKIVHMSLKMAKILEFKRQYENAENGYQYCLKILQNQVDQATDNLDVLTLWAMTLDWYAHMLLDLSRLTEAMKYIKLAYDMCIQLNGEVHEQSVVLLNDLGTIAFMKENFDEAIEYLTKATEIGEKIPEMEDLPAIYINLGNVYIKKGLLDEAKRLCTKGWKMSKNTNNYESLDEAKTCLDEVNKLLSS